MKKQLSSRLVRDLCMSAAALLMVSGVVMAEFESATGGVTTGKRWENQRRMDGARSGMKAAAASHGRARQGAVRGDSSMYGNVGPSSSARAESSRSSRASSVASDTSDVDVKALVSQWGNMIGARHAAKQADAASGDARAELSKWRDGMITRSSGWTHDASDRRIKDLKRMLKFYKKQPVSYFDAHAAGGGELPGEHFIDARSLDDFSMTTPGGDLRLAQIRRKLGPAGMKRLADAILGNYYRFKEKVRQRQEYFERLGASPDIAADLAKAEARMKARGELSGANPGPVPADLQRALEAQRDAAQRREAAERAERRRTAEEHKRFRESRTGRAIGAVSNGFLRAGQLVEDTGSAFTNSAAGREIARSAKSAASTLGGWARGAWNWGRGVVDEVRTVGDVADGVSFE